MGFQVYCNTTECIIQVAKALGEDISFVKDIRLVTRKGLSMCECCCVTV